MRDLDEEGSLTLLRKTVFCQQVLSVLPLQLDLWKLISSQPHRVLELFALWHTLLVSIKSSSVATTSTALELEHV